MAYIGNQKEVSKFKEMSPGLIRQRRNLIGSSIALLIIEFGDVTLDKINILGNELKLNNSGSIQVAAFIACAYFLFRYYQYIQANNGMGLLKEYRGFRRAVAWQYAKILIDVDEPQLSDVTAVGLRLSVVYSTPIQNFIPNNGYQVPSLQLTIYRSLLIQMQVLFHLTIHTPLVTDYVLPYVLVTAAISAHLWSYIL